LQHPSISPYASQHSNHQLLFPLRSTLASRCQSHPDTAVLLQGLLRGKSHSVPQRERATANNAPAHPLPSWRGREAARTRREEHLNIDGRRWEHVKPALAYGVCPHPMPRDKSPGNPMCRLSVCMHLCQLWTRTTSWDELARSRPTRVTPSFSPDLFPKSEARCKTNCPSGEARARTRPTKQMPPPCSYPTKCPWTTLRAW
jgi:hypothetical protein